MPESSKEELARRIAEYPKEALTFFNAGIFVASKLSEDTRNLILKEVIDSFKRGTGRVAGAMLRPIAGVRHG